MVPGTQFEAAVMSGAEKQDVPLAKAHPLGLFTLLQFRGCDSLARFQPLSAAEARDIEQNSAADDALGTSCDVQGLGSAGGDVRGRSSVIQAALVRDVAESVDVGVAIAMDLAGMIVQREPRLALSERPAGGRSMSRAGSLQ